MVTTTVVTAALQLAGLVGLGATLLLLPLVYMVCCGFVMGAVALAKWVVSGRFRPCVKPLWSPFVWRLEAVTALYEFLLTPLALEPLRGTPFLVWYLRLLGARLGRGVYIHTTGLIEFDLAEVGDRAATNDEAVLQSHLFEDRMLKASGLRVGAGCTVGAGSVVLYDAEMEDGSRLDALSLLMKGETLPEEYIVEMWRSRAAPTHCRTPCGHRVASGASVGGKSFRPASNQSRRKPCSAALIAPVVGGNGDIVANVFAHHTALSGTDRLALRLDLLERKKSL